MFKNNFFMATLIQVVFLGACSKNEAQSPQSLTPDVIQFTQLGLYPEGVAFDQNSKTYFVSSLTKGAIGTVNDQGVYQVFANDNNLVSTTGIVVDRAQNRLLVAIADPGTSTKTTMLTQGKLGAIAIYNLTNGQQISYINLGILKPTANHFANDMAVDNLGNIYVTDSFAGIIYKINTQGVASIFYENSAFEAPAGAFGLNGIVFHPNGYLIVAKYNEGILYKIPLQNPSSFSQIVLPQTIKGADGLSIDNTNANTLVVACNDTTNKVFQINTTNNWSTATITATFDTGNVFPTTIASRNNDKYVLYARLNNLFSGQSSDNVFQIQKIKF